VELNLHYLLPEIIILIAASVALLVGLAQADSIRRLAQWVAAIGLFVAYHFTSTGFGQPADWLYRPEHALPFDPNYISALTCVIGLLTVLVSWDMPSKSDPSLTDTRFRGEFFSMLLFSLAGVSMMGKVNDLVWLFIALELVSIPTYILVATSRGQIAAQEAGVKYFFLGALSAAIFLFGFSYIYGYTGSTGFADIAARFTVDIQHNSVPPIAAIGVLMVLVGVFYKIAAVPMHFYTPDVYQGAATPVTAYLAFAPKAAGIVAIISTLNLIGYRSGIAAGQQQYPELFQVVMGLLVAIAALTMSVGNVLALLQRNIKRTLAYSSIAHSGYMLVGLAAGPAVVVAASQSQLKQVDGYTAALFYLAGYAIMNLGAFAVIIFLQGKTDAAEDIEDLNGLAKDHPVAALAFAVCLFSLIGMPLTIGFFGKFYLVKAALVSDHKYLAIILVINAAIAAAYYLKIISAMYLRDSWNPFSVRRALPIRVTALFCTAVVIILGVYPPLLLDQMKSPRPAAEKAAAPVAAAR